MTGVLATPFVGAIAEGADDKALAGCRVGRDMGPPRSPPPPTLGAPKVLLGAMLLKKFGC